MYSGVSPFPLVTLLCALAASVHTGCRSDPPAAIEFESEAATVDGLHRVKGTPLQAIYVKPGARLHDCSEVMVDPFMISYERFVGLPDNRHPRRAYERGAGLGNPSAGEPRRAARRGIGVA
jgi:hypothetical protein